MKIASTPSLYLLDALENRRLMSTDPAVVLGLSYYANARVELKNALTASMQADLTAHIARQTSGTNDQKFDKALLELMRAKPGASSSAYGGAVIRSSASASGLDGNYYVSSAQSGRTDTVAARAQQIRVYDDTDSSRMKLRPTNGEVPKAAAVPQASDVGYDGLAANNGTGDQSEASTGFDAIVTGDVNDFSSLHRFNRWRQWAQALQYMQTANGTSNPAVPDTAGATVSSDYTLNSGVFVKRISYELADWSTAVKPSSTAGASGPKNKLVYLDFNGGSTATEYDNFNGARLDAIARAENFTWVYPMIVDSPNWTPADNTLLLYQIVINGRYLNAQAGGYSASMPYNQTPSDPVLGFQRRDYNKIITHGTSLVTAGTLFQEFSESGSWVTRGHDVLFNRGDGYSAIAESLYADGGHREQSSDYWRNSMLELAELYALDTRPENNRGSVWTAADLTNGQSGITILRRSHQLFYDLITPDGQSHVLGQGGRQNMETSIAIDALVGTSYVPDRILETSAYMWIKEPSAFPKHPTDFYNWIPTGRGYYSSTLADSGTYVVRSNEIGATESAAADPNARSILFRGGDLDLTPNRQPSTLGMGSHARSDLLALDMVGNGVQLLSGYDDSTNEKSAKGRNLMTVASSTSITDLFMRDYRDSRADATITVKGRWDNTTTGIGNRDYIQATSWHDAWKKFNAPSGYVEPLSGSNAGVSRSVWMLNGSNSANATTRGEQRFGTTLVFDWGQANVDQAYNVHNYAPLASGASSWSDAGFASRVSIANGSDSTEVTSRLIALPGQTVARSVVSSGNKNYSHLEYKQTAKTAVFANLITTKFNGGSTPSFNAKWQKYDTAGSDFRVIVMKNPSNPSSTATFADEMWAVNFEPDGTTIAARDAVANPINAAWFDKAVGVAADGTESAGSITSAATWNVIKDFNTGDSLRYERIQFGSAGATGIKIRMATNATTNQIEVRLDSSTSSPVATLTAGNTSGGFTDYTLSFGQTITGVHDILISSPNLAPSSPASLQSFQLIAPTALRSAVFASHAYQASESTSIEGADDEENGWLSSGDSVI